MRYIITRRMVSLFCNNSRDWLFGHLTKVHQWNNQIEVTYLFYGIFFVRPWFFLMAKGVSLCMAFRSARNSSQAGQTWGCWRKGGGNTVLSICSAPQKNLRMTTCCHIDRLCPWISAPNAGHIAFGGLNRRCFPVHTSDRVHGVMACHLVISPIKGARRGLLHSGLFIGKLR